MGEKVVERSDIVGKTRTMFFLLMFLPLFVVGKALDNDIWFILNNGRYVLANGIPHIDPFSLHEGFSYVMQQWLSATIYWSVYSRFGVIGLNILLLTLFGLFIFLFYKLCMLVSEKFFFVSFSITLLASGFMFPFFTHRPSAFTSVLLLIELFALEKYVRENEIKWLFMLPLISVLIINLQAAMWPMIFIFGAPYVIDSFELKTKALKTQGYPTVPLLVSALTVLLSGFINPYGIKAMTYLITSYGHGEISNFISEMSPLNVNRIMGLIIFCAVILIGISYATYKKGRTRLRYVILLLGTSYMMFAATRNLSFFVIGSFFPLAYFFSSLKMNSGQEEISSRTKVIRIILILMISVGLIVVFYKNYDTWDTSLDAYEDIEEVFSYIDSTSNNSEVILFTDFNDGGYAEYQGYAPYIDPRADVFLKENNSKKDVLEEYTNLLTSQIYYKDFIDDYGFTHILVQEFNPMYIMLQYDEDFELAFDNDKYRMYEKR